MTAWEILNENVKSELWATQEQKIYDILDNILNNTNVKKTK